MLKSLLFLKFGLFIIFIFIVMETKIDKSWSNVDVRNNMSFLQQHVSFFDINKDGVIYPWESFAGSCALGYSNFFSVVLTINFHGLFSYATLPGWIPSLLFPIYVANIHKDKHGSDTGNYDYDGMFVQMNFDNLVKRYANTEPDKLTLGELWKMTEEHKVIFDFVGWIVTKVEFGLLYFLAKDEDGFLSREAFYQFYDGTLFYNIAMKRNEGKLNRNSSMD